MVCDVSKAHIDNFVEEYCGKYDIILKNRNLIMQKEKDKNGKKVFIGT